MKSQSQLILKHLQSGKTLTAKQAAKMPFCCMRLAARVHDLNKRGYFIGKDMIRRKSPRTGKPEAYARYFEVSGGDS